MFYSHSILKTIAVRFLSEIVITKRTQFSVLLFQYFREILFCTPYSKIKFNNTLQVLKNAFIFIVIYKESAFCYSKNIDKNKI